jgi:ribosomal protein L14
VSREGSLIGLMFRILEVQFLPPHLLLFSFLIFKYMLIARSNVNIVDNTGVKQVYLILDSGKTAKVGDVVTCAVKRVRATSTKFPKGSVAYVLITSTNFGSTYKDGLSVRSVGANNGVLVSKLNDPLGSRISTPFSRQSFRRKGFSKVLSIAPFSLLFFFISMAPSFRKHWKAV